MHNLTVWYDGSCPLCIREISFMRSLDKKGAIAFLDLTLPETTCPLERTFMLENFHAREGKQLLHGAAAFAAMWRAIPMLRPFGLIARLPGILPLLDSAYRLFLRFRPRIQRFAAARIKS